MAQTFVAPVGTLALTEFQFWLRDIDEFDSQTFRGYIFEWAGDRITGPILYQSLPRAGTAWDGGSIPYTFESGPLLLRQNQTYAAVLSPVGFVPDRGTIGGVFLEEANRYAPFGQAWEVSSGNSEGIQGLRSRPWTARERADDNGVPPDDYIEGRDFSFTATFRDETYLFPEPGTWALLATGLAGVAGVAKWRSRRG